MEAHFYQSRRLLRKYIRYRQYLGRLRRDKAVARYILWFLATGFILLSLFVYWVPTTSLEIAISRELQEEKHPVLTAYMQFVSWFGYNQTAIPTILLTALLFSLFSYWREALFTLLTSLASVINSGLKLLIDRPRPTADVVEIYSTLQTNSFPSGHVVHYVVFFGFLLIVLYRLHRLNTYLRLVLALFFVLLIFSVPFSRMYLGAHWFIDVLAGFFLGLILLSGLLYFYFPANKRVE